MKRFLKTLVLLLTVMTTGMLLTACGNLTQKTDAPTKEPTINEPVTDEPENKNCLITFNTNGGTYVESQEIIKGNKITKPVTTKTNYDFFGWYIDAQFSKKFDFDTSINQDITLYAKWSNDASELYNFQLTNDYSFYGITGYNGESENITLPRLHNGLRVISVNSNAFKNNTTLKKVTLPNTIENIYTSAFESCTNLSYIEIPNSVHSIGMNAFRGCTSLDNVIIPGSVETIGENSFQNCSGLTTLTLENGIETIEPMAFDYCTALREVVLPNSVTTVGGMAFRHCDSLTAVTISTGMSGIANAMFQYCGSLQSLTLPANIVSIGISAMSYCYSLENLQILGNITLFGNSAFYDCQNLKSIYWAANVTGNYQSDGDNYIFYNAGISNNGITLTMAPNANLPVGVFMPYQNSNIPKITTLIFEDGTTTIDSTEYNRMPYLTNITTPDSVREITTGIFDNTPWYQAQPNGVVYIDNIIYGYKGADYTISLDSSGGIIIDNLPIIPIIYNAEFVLPTPVRSGYGFDGWYYNDTKVKNGIYTYTTSIKLIAHWSPIFTTQKVGSSFVITGLTDYGENNYQDIIVPNAIDEIQVTSIGSSAFYYCNRLTSITIPDSVTSIGDDAFSYCSGLTSITIPDSVTSIGDDAFYNCSRLTSITIPDSVTSIGKLAFYNCSGLTSITIPDSVTSIGSSAFSGCSGLTSMNYLGTLDQWVQINFGNCYSSPTYYTKKLVINGQKVTNAVISNGVTSIGSYAFYDCSGLTSITIPDSVTSIGDWAFYNCSGLTSIAIPDSVRSIGNHAFYKCSGLTSITIYGVTSIGFYAFADCSGLTSITIPYSVTSIGSSAFSGWTSNQTIYCKASKPSGWDSSWNSSCSARIMWGY